MGSTNSINKVMSAPVHVKRSYHLQQTFLFSSASKIHKLSIRATRLPLSQQTNHPTTQSCNSPLSFSPSSPSTLPSPSQLSIPTASKHTTSKQSAKPPAGVHSTTPNPSLLAIVRFLSTALRSTEDHLPTSVTPSITPTAFTASFPATATSSSLPKTLTTT